MQDGMINVSYEMVMMAERITHLIGKKDRGKFKYKEKQELDALLTRYLELQRLKKEG
jgi:hypothetical protein